MKTQTNAGLAFLVLSLAGASLAVAACGDDGGAAAVAATGGSAGTAGGGGAAGASTGGTSAGGKSGASTGGSAGTGGGAGNGGAAGTVAAGAAGTAGGGGGCTTDDQCPKVLSTIPANCATGKCDAGTCVFVTVDADGDGHRTSKCKPNDPAAFVSIGDDCDDTDATVSPSGWDGPAGGGKPNHCSDGVDQNCSGAEDDQKLPDGSTCTCTPGDSRSCSEDDLGKKVSFPNLVNGKPILPCALGGQTCLASGKWGPCTGLKAPQPETCDEQDNDCNGVKDDNASDAQLWVWDADNDQHGAVDCAATLSCKNVPPKDRPTGCASGDCVAGDCANAAWKLAAAVVADDCDDENAKRQPGLPEICDDIDNDCNLQVDDGTGAKKGWLFDVDGDGYIAASSPKRFDCAVPTVCPDGISSCDVSRWTPDTTPKLDCNDNDGTINRDAVEVCGDDVDQNCQGGPSDGCGACTPGASLECYTGDAGSAFGAPSTCKKGTAVCGANGQPGECQGQVLPATESCNGLDDNCDGQVDEGFNVAPNTACNVDNENVGACAGGGVRKCVSNVGVCEPLDPDIGQLKFRGQRSPKASGATGSFDWSCDGKEEKQWTFDNNDYSTQCDLENLFNGCDGDTLLACIGANKNGKNRRFCGGNATVSPPCGSEGLEIHCKWDTPTKKCSFDKHVTVFQGCR